MVHLYLYSTYANMNWFNMYMYMYIYMHVFIYYICTVYGLCMYLSIPCAHKTPSPKRNQQLVWKTIESSGVGVVGRWTLSRCPKISSRSLKEVDDLWGSCPVSLKNVGLKGLKIQVEDKGNGRLQLGSGRCCCIYIIWESGKHLWGSRWSSAYKSLNWDTVRPI